MIGRQLGIIYLLLSGKNVTARELAQRFEVSVRTIYRDVEALSLAGIPIYARKGKNGGISLTENFVLDKMMLSKQEQESILAAVAGMRETGAADDDKVLQKLGSFFQMEEESWVSIDFSDWSDRRKELFLLVKKAVLEKRLLRFDYYGQNNVMKSRTVEPLQLLFKEYTWYLRAYCRERRGMRLFKIMRMKRAECLNETFIPDFGKYGKHIGNEAESWRQQDEGTEKISFLVAASEAWRIYDRFEEEEVTCLEDGSFLIQMQVRLDEWVYGMILSFGAAARVIGPAYVKEEVCRRLRESLKKYENGI